MQKPFKEVLFQYEWNWQQQNKFKHAYLTDDNCEQKKNMHFSSEFKCLYH